jgi:hypothetical protein
MGRRAFGVADDGGEDDGSVDFRPAALAGSSGRSVENALQVLGNENLRLRPPAAVFDAAKLIGDLAGQTRNVDVAQSQNLDGVRVFRQREQQMLQCHLRMRLGIGIARCARQCRSQALPHRYAIKTVDDHELLKVHSAHMHGGMGQPAIHEPSLTSSAVRRIAGVETLPTVFAHRV